MPSSFRGHSSATGGRVNPQSFMHSLLTKGRLLFTDDETIADLLRRMSEIGEAHTQVQLLRCDPRSGADLQGPQVAGPRRP